MDANQFQHLLRALSHHVTRRGVARLVTRLGVGGVLTASLALTGVQARKGKARKGKKKPCGPCRTRRKGWCLRTDNAACGADRTGRCRGGKCQPRPDCLAADAACGASCEQCCSDRSQGPEPGICLQGLNGKPCLTDADCRSGNCFAYRCGGPYGHPGDVCVVTTHCVGGPCIDDVCQPGQTLDPCEVDGDCASGSCSGQTCQ